MLEMATVSVIIPFLTVGKRKNRCIPCIYWGTAIFCFVTKYSILFSSFAFFLNVLHFTFGYKLIISTEPAGLVKCICYSFSFI